MEKIHYANIIKSFFLGLFMGVILQFLDTSDTAFTYRAMVVLASGSIGLIIGFLTEWVTALLPINIANPRTYFFINNLIALLVTACIMITFYMLSRGEIENRGEFTTSLLIVLAIICIANVLDYVMYRRAQKRLERFKNVVKRNNL
ncbi:hypothetical protein BK126_17540 [Paenibacillus sp. FSL H7-0326]|uniref:hypothetical protein n=1 Tax=Paenibacillus sp. FSL H7-0326 TaxID=1921144 RepID=UPI00096DF785|nr:hypothetical protein [Paenibacillus sp. FSL H7-0326]OMC67398.1 hypothetical protein BK126_17540 [Paenibacillus sp. FSL H7-0326]